jgi:hypothetical protein
MYDRLRTYHCTNHCRRGSDRAGTLHPDRGGVHRLVPRPQRPGPQPHGRQCL